MGRCRVPSWVRQFVLCLPGGRAKHLRGRRGR